MTPEPLSTQAARIASLTTAANYLLSRSSPADARVTQTLVMDLLDCAGILAAELSNQAGQLEDA